jgi:hypothetical protein
MRMLIVGYCYGLRSERRLTQEIELHLAFSGRNRCLALEGFGNVGARLAARPEW